MTADGEVFPDHGLVAPVALPAGSRIPEPGTGCSTPAEYDRYFRIVRDDPGLLPWTRACLRINGELLEDLQRTGLTAEDKCQILHGLVTVQQLTLQRWVAVGDTVTGPAREGSGTGSTGTSRPAPGTAGNESGR